MSYATSVSAYRDRLGAASEPRRIPTIRPLRWSPEAVRSRSQTDSMRGAFLEMPPPGAKTRTIIPARDARPVVGWRSGHEVYPHYRQVSRRHHDRMKPAGALDRRSLRQAAPLIGRIEAGMDE